MLFSANYTVYIRVFISCFVVLSINVDLTLHTWLLTLFLITAYQSCLLSD